MKEVSHRKETSCHAFVQRKLVPKQLDNKAVRYGKSNEELAIRTYVTSMRKNGKTIDVHKCGLGIEPTEPWLSASPDGIVIEKTSSGLSEGCLEVKCPLTCEKTAFADACKSVTGFCLVERNSQMQ